VILVFLAIIMVGGSDTRLASENEAPPTATVERQTNPPN
jgi:hypothetical protein